MNGLTKIKIIFLVVLAVIILFLFSFFYRLNFQSGNEHKPLFKIGNSEIKVDVVDTSSERAKGLSGRNSLAPNEGMLFNFDHPDFWGIWMKEMNFSIDIIWMDENMKVVDIKTDASPDSYPEVFYPKQKSSYVLELNAGFAKEHGINVGGKMSSLEK